ncbi:MAG: hypothetical protein Q4F60_02485 [Candidatus Saccharibacteria bacterium]|nr:hypothetical protein [Candidatus Saccharibacteria bacterium]
MRKTLTVFLISIFSFGFLTAMNLGVLAVHAIPERPGNPGAPATLGAPGGQLDSSSVSYSGTTEISSDTNASGEKYYSDEAGKNALLFSGGISTLINPTIEKYGDSSGENSDFYGINAAVLAYNGATVDISGGTIETKGSYANAVFAYGDAVVNISDTEIKTAANNSGGIMVTGGGTLNAKNLTVETQGNSSAAIRSDRGGGTENIDGGTYTTNGVGSPAIYSTADVSVSNATLNSTVSEGAVIEGLNTITLTNTIVNNSNTELNGNSETYKNIFIYQSMSGDAEEGTGTFSAKNSTLNESHGDNFFVTNTSAKITLENNKFNNTSEEFVFLKATSGKWGNAGSNGGNVSLSAINQNLKGDFVIDDVSSLALNLTQGSYLLGAINSAHTAKKSDISLDDSSIWVLTADSYVDSLDNSVAATKNIYSNGYTLYVDGSAVATNPETPPAMDESDDGADLSITSVEQSESAVNTELSEPDINKENKDDALWWVLGGVAGGIIIAIIIILLLIKKKPTKAPAESSPEIELPRSPSGHQS